MTCCIQAPPVCLGPIDPDHDETREVVWGSGLDGDDATLGLACVFCARWIERHPYDASLLVMERGMVPT